MTPHNHSYRVITSAKLVRDLRFKALGGSEADYSNGCTSPPQIELRGQPDKITHEFLNEKRTPEFFAVLVPCRKCKVCLRNRSKRWAAKAHTETMSADRTWFGTLTFNTAERFKHKLNAQYRATCRGHIWSAMSASEQFGYIHSETGAEVTKWIKRIRKNSGASLRYLLVVEPHKDGFPHYHILVHEHSHPIGERLLRGSWERNGFAVFTLAAAANAPWYVCKYMAKTALCRIRASQQYGPSAGRSLTERVISATRQIIRPQVANSGEQNRLSK